MKGLLVHPSATMRRVFAGALKDAGCDEVIEATDPCLALEQCDQTIGLVITEWSRRGTEALDLTKGIRARNDCEATRILVVSARDTRDDVNEAIQAGINGYILKPFTEETLRRKIGELAETADRGPAEGDDTAAVDSAQEAPATPAVESRE